MHKDELAALRESVKGELSPYRYQHTLGVEKMIVRLAAMYAPAQTEELQAAALLHDITKEKNDAAQRESFARHGISLREDEARAPKIWHGITAAAEIPVRYPAFATETVLRAVRWHTTGRAGMDMAEMLLFLADYIEEGRTFPDCVALRQAFFEVNPENMPWEARLAHLKRTVQTALAHTIEELQAQNAAVCEDTRAALDSLLAQTLA